MKYIFLLLVLVAGFFGLFYYQRHQPEVDFKIKETSDTIYQATETIAPQPTKIVEQTGLPDKYLIETAFIEQAPEKNWDQPWQDACEEAAVLTVHFYYQNQTPTAQQQAEAILDMINHEQQDHGWGHDINLDQMAHFSRDHFGYQTKIIENPRLDDLKTTLSTNLPIIVPASGKTLYQENRYFRNGGPAYHAIVILGYDDSRRQFIVHDVGTQHGAYFRYSYDLLLKSIHDLPSSGKQNILDGSPRVLLLLK